MSLESEVLTPASGLPWSAERSEQATFPPSFGKELVYLSPVNSAEIQFGDSIVMGSWIDRAMYYRLLGPLEHFTRAEPGAVGRRVS